MIHSSKLTSILASCGLVAAIGVVPAAVAAASSGAAPLVLAQAEQQADQFDDTTIEAFAAAQARVAELQALYVGQYEAAESEEQRLQISEEATQEMMAAVEATPDITLEEYNAVVEAAHRDAALVDRIYEAIENTGT